MPTHFSLVGHSQLLSITSVITVRSLEQPVTNHNYSDIRAEGIINFHIKVCLSNSNVDSELLLILQLNL